MLDPPDDSNCARSSSELVWLNPAHLLQRVKLPQTPYDRQLMDSAFGRGLALKGDVQFELKVPGPHLVEVFLAVDGATDAVTLEAGGAAVDAAQPAGVRPSGELQGVTLLGVVTGRFTLRARSLYVLSAIRWTPREEFETRLAPVWLDRARQIAGDPFFEGQRSARLGPLKQLYDRLALSTRAEVRREAVIGQARVAYWQAAKSHQREDIDRATAALREAFQAAPEDETVRQMISASCSEKNVRGARMPYGVFCVDAKPVPWEVSLAPGAVDAPEWAVTQARLAARLEAVTQWWVTRRQQANGELGGGWRDDAELVRQWGWQAVALGSPAATSGVRRFDEGLAAEGEAREFKDVAGEIHRLALAAAGSSAGVRRAMPGRDRASEVYSEPLPSEVVWNMAYLAKDAEKSMARDFAMFTSEAVYTGRVYYPVPPDYWNYVVSGEAKPGDPEGAIAATFVPDDASYARAVVQAGPETLKLRLYSFEGRTIQAQVRLWRLEPGAYRWESADVVGTRVAAGSLIVTGRPQAVAIPLAPGREIEVTFTRVRP